MTAPRRPTTVELVETHRPLLLSLAHALAAIEDERESGLTEREAQRADTVLSLARNLDHWAWLLIAEVWDRRAADAAPSIPTAEQFSHLPHADDYRHSDGDR